MAGRRHPQAPSTYRMSIRLYSHRRPAPRYSNGRRAPRGVRAVKNKGPKTGGVTINFTPGFLSQGTSSQSSGEERCYYCFLCSKLIEPGDLCCVKCTGTEECEEWAHFKCANIPKRASQAVIDALQIFCRTHRESSSSSSVGILMSLSTLCFRACWDTYH